MRGQFHTVCGRSRKRGSFGYSCKWNSGFIEWDQSGTMQEIIEGGTGIFQGGVDHSRTGDQHQVPARSERGKHRPHSLAQQSLGSISLNGVSNRAPGCYSNTDLRRLVRLGNQYNKRVGIGLAVSPHPHELI